jgi:predicted transglutaminase-like cysteine proteinase
MGVFYTDIQIWGKQSIESTKKDADCQRFIKFFSTKKQNHERRGVAIKMLSLQVVTLR